MAQAQFASLLAILVLAFVLVLGRRLVFSWSTIGVFVLANGVFVIAGVVAAPWIWGSAAHWFTGFDLAAIAPDALTRAIVLSVGGVLLVLVGYEYAYFIRRRGKLVIAAPKLLRVEPGMPLGFRRDLVVIAALVVLAASAGFVAIEGREVLRGITRGWIAGDPTATVSARLGITDNYLFVLIVYNIAPLVSVALWMVARRSRNIVLSLLALALVAATVGDLLAVFQKRPLLVYLGALALAELTVRNARHRERVHRRKRLGKFARSARMASIGLALFAILMALYYVSTGVRSVTHGPLETASLLATIAAQRVVGRLAMPAIMYADFFPRIAGFYGIANVGLLAKLTGHALYLDTSTVYRQYSISSMPGSLAVSALTDFYGAGGYVVWFLGAIGVGVLLQSLDTWLARLRLTFANQALVIFAFVFTYYLSQASVARALAGYGGVFFLLGWWVLRAVHHDAPAHTALGNGRVAEQES